MQPVAASKKARRAIYLMKTSIIFILLLGILLCRPGFCGEIHDAAKSGDLEKVKELLKDNPDLVASKDNYGATPLHWAALTGQYEVVGFLLNNNANVNAKSTNGMTPLHQAAYHDHKDVKGSVLI
jgi:ankyrin repeat protein